MACAAETLAVKVAVPPVAIFALELEIVIDVGVAALPPPPPPPEPPPPPQPKANVDTQRNAREKRARYLRFRVGIPIKKRNATVLASDNPHQSSRDSPNKPAFLICGLAANAAGADPVVLSVSMTCTGPPARLTVVGFTVSVVPGGAPPDTDTVTVLGVLLAGAIVRVALPVWPIVAESVLGDVKVKSGMLTVTTVPLACPAA